jgi:hypothetical protein
MVLSFTVSDASSGANLKGNLIVGRMGLSVIVPFVDGKAEVALNSLGTAVGTIAYEIWVPGYVPKKDFLIGVYPRTIDVKLSKIQEGDLVK